MTSAHSADKDSLLFLHTSPEFNMKRILASGSGSIYQIAHVFRDEETGKRHNTEFSMLEWYRLDFDYYQLLLMATGITEANRMTYGEAFLSTVQLDPHTTEINQLQKIAGEHGWGSDSDDHHALLDYIFSEAVIKKPDHNQALFIYDYPQCMVASATLKQAEPCVRERFELFINGMEIADERKSAF